MRTLRVAIIVSALAVTAAHAKKPQIQWNEEYDFAAVETFQWQTTLGTSLASVNPFMHSRVVATIEYELTDWLTEVSSDPDVYVTYHTSSQDKVRLQTNSWGYGFGGYGRGRWDYYGYGFGGPVYSTTTVHEYEQGTLVVDIWDAASQELVWRGTVTRVFSQNVEKAERQVVKAIHRMAKRGRQLWGRANR